MDHESLQIKEKIRTWWDNPHQDYDAIKAHGVHSDLEKEMWSDAIARILGDGNGLKILDIGTGTGFLALLLASNGYQVTGVDWSAHKIDSAKGKASDMGVNVDFKVQDAEKLAFEDGTFDAVVSRHVIWTLFDPHSASKEWARVVKSGGKVIADVPKMGSHHGDHHFGAEIGKSLPFYNGADTVDVIKMFEESGLKDISSITLEKTDDSKSGAVIVYGEKA